MTRSPSSASRATRASTDARSVSDIAHASSTASGAPFTATHAPSASRHTALSRRRTGSNGYRARRSLGGRSPAASASARSTGSCAAAAPCAAAATVSTCSRSPSMCSISSRFSVSVPVLSASSTVIAPTASAARSRRRRTPCCARRRPPSATSAVTRIGSSSGIVANASVSPSSSISRAGWPRSTPMSGTSTHAVTATISAARASSAIARCSGVGGSLASATSRPRRPISVSSPSATTTPSPAPATTAVPACSSEERSASGASASTGSGPFAAATGSPVSLDSSVGQAVGLDDAGVGRDDAAGLDEQHVADHERADRDRLRDARPPDERVGGAEVAQRLQRALRPDLGDRLDGADEHDDRRRSRSRRAARRRSPRARRPRSAAA